MTLRLVAFNGPPRSGKDTGANAVQAIDGLDTFKQPLALILKNLTCRFFDTPSAWFYYENMKDKSNDAFWGMTPREAYIWMSEEVIKPKFGKEFFGKALVKDLDHIFPFGKSTNPRHKVNKFIVVSDVGFREEWKVFQEYFGWDKCLLLRVKRPGHDFSSDSRYYIEMETECDYITDVENNSDITTYQDKVQSIVRTFIGD